MKHFTFYLGMALSLVASCSVQEKDCQIPAQDDTIFYAFFEQPGEDGTKVYADEDLLLRWTADDRVSIFNKNTYNQQYQFTGNTGANAGGFKKVETDEFMTGNAISHVVSVYPYLESTEISEDETLALVFPSEQHYAENTFGLGANTMVSVTSDNFLQYKNIGGYLVLKLYGEGISVSSITLRGNNGEKLAGKASVSMRQNGAPTVSISDEATSSITLICENPIALGETMEESTQFWFVVPPGLLSKGFSVTVNKSTGRVFEKTTTKSVRIERNKLSKMSPIEVEDNIDFYDDVVKSICVENWDINGDGELSYREAAAVTSFRKGAGDSSSVFYGRNDISAFDEIQHFTGLPLIEPRAFYDSSLLYIWKLPEGVMSIGKYAFARCHLKYAPRIPNSVKVIEEGAFFGCNPLSEITIPDSVEIIGKDAFSDSFFYYLFIGKGVKEIGEKAFSSYSRAHQIVIEATTPPIGAPNMFNDADDCPICVPIGSVASYKSAPYWSDYANRIQAISL